MKIRIGSAKMTQDTATGSVAQVQFEVEGHPKGYEITLYSKDGKEWDYGLHFSGESGKEEDISAVEALLEEDDDTFEQLVNAALHGQRN